MLTDTMSTFLASAGWGDATVAKLAGDASNRRYLRLSRGDGTRAVLMDAPPERGEDTRPFLRIARHLASLGLSAPTIYAEDTDAGLLLIEDLGDGLYARLAAADPDMELPLYLAAVDMLDALHRHPAPKDLMPYDSTTMPDLGALALEWYTHFGDKTAAPDDRAALTGLLQTALKPFDTAPRVLVQRDFHAENLLWLPQRHGVARVGLLDFQDAASGHAAYDLVSLLEDARRDVSQATVTAALEHYCALSGMTHQRLELACAVMGAQRNLRILGVFARLSLHFGKPGYIDLIPRVWDHLQTDLSHPDLAALNTTVTEILPSPEAAHLQRLKDLCATVPTL